MRFRAARCFFEPSLVESGNLVDAQEDSQPTEYQIKAAFIFNFAKFVEWPTAAFPKASSPIVVGVLRRKSVCATAAPRKTIKTEVE